MGEYSVSQCSQRSDMTITVTVYAPSEDEALRMLDRAIRDEQARALGLPRAQEDLS